LIINTQFKFSILVLLVISATGSFAQTDSEFQQSVGTAYPGTPTADKPFPGLKEMGAQLDLFYMYTNFQGDDMSATYGGLSQFGAGISFATGDRTRFFISARYGQSSGDPYHSIDGISLEDGVTVKALPLLIGMKINASSRKDFRCYFGGGFQFAFTWEDINTSDGNDNPVDMETSGTTTGYYVFVAPEFPLGKSKALGAEFGWGGSKGDVKSSSHSHGVDLTGAHVRVYFTFDL